MSLRVKQGYGPDRDPPQPTSQAPAGKPMKDALMREVESRCPEAIVDGKIDPTRLPQVKLHDDTQHGRVKTNYGLVTDQTTLLIPRSDGTTHEKNIPYRQTYADRHLRVALAAKAFMAKHSASTPKEDDQSENKKPSGLDEEITYIATDAAAKKAVEEVQRMGLVLPAELQTIQNNMSTLADRLQE